MSAVVRCFVAVWPTPAVVSALSALPRPAMDGLRWTTESQWHVTLRFFGELSPVEVTTATAALSAVASSWPDQPTAQGGPGTRFLGPGLLVWPVEGLEAVAEAVERTTAQISQPVPGRPFFGHMTMARGRRGADLRPARHLLSSLVTSWPATSISLVQSELHPDGARYHDLERFSIGPAAPA